MSSHADEVWPGEGRKGLSISVLPEYKGQGLVAFLRVGCALGHSPRPIVKKMEAMKMGTF